MKARYSLEDIPYELYSNCYDKIVDIIKTNELKQNNGNDLYHINRTIIIENRRLDNVRVVFAKTILDNDCMNHIFAYISDFVYRNEEYNIPNCKFADKKIETSIANGELEKYYKTFKPECDMTYDQILKQAFMRSKNLIVYATLDLATPNQSCFVSRKQLFFFWKIITT